MADTFTTHYNLTKPQIGGDPDTWGTLLNANFDTIDSQLYTASTYALPLTGGIVTGNSAVATAAGNSRFNIASNAGTTRTVGFQTQSGSTYSGRWDIQASSTAESGSNAGSDFQLLRYNDSGANLDSGALITISRATGFVTYTNGTYTSGSSAMWTYSAGTSGTAYNLITNTNTSGYCGWFVQDANAGVFRVGSSLSSYAGASSMNVGTFNSSALGFVTNNTLRGSVSSTGAWSISGALTVSGTLTGSGDVVANQNFSSSTINVVLATNAGSGGGVYLRPNGEGSTAGQAVLNQAGVMTAADFTATSDERLKSKIRTLRRGVDALKQMLPREYIKAGREEIGYIAQEAQKVIPEAVHEGEDGYLSLSPLQVCAMLGRAILEIDARLELAGL